MDSETIELFGMDEVLPSIEELVESAMAAIMNLFLEGRPVICAFSGGKDSSVVAALTLNTAAAYAAQGGKPFVIFTTGDTLVENPEIVEHYRAELAKAREFGKRHGIRVHTKIVTPSLAASFQVGLLSGRTLPSWAGAKADCTPSWKIQPQRAYRNKLFRELKAENLPEPVTMLGTRFDESERRAMHMTARGDRWDTPVRNKDGELILCPVARWTTDDIWSYVGTVSSGMCTAYTDFAETVRIYSHSAGTSCAVVADAIYDGAKSKKGACGARHGCFVCQQAEDRSLEAMIEYDPRYEYARGLNKLNKFLRAIRYDWSRRHWVGRTIRGGFIAVQPDTLHPSTIRELTRYMLQLDYDEEVRASIAREKPKFRILPEDMMLAVDAMQSLNGVARPFQMWADYRDIRRRGARFDVPELEPAPRSNVPDARFLYVGDDWDETAGYLGLTGLRDPYFEALTELSGCAHELKTLPGGRMAWDLHTGQEMTVDSESLAMLMDFEMETMLAKFDRGFCPGGITEAYKFYVSYGVLNVSHSQQREHDEVCRRTAYKDRLGLTLDYDIEGLLSRTVGFSELPPQARREWAHKATTDSSQTDFLAVLEGARECLLDAA
ncbi:phosphoadenosine phosphosulfate reductase domain-containing protein [Rubrivivax gelatinosus]|uniref:phosphoadenosine phosphosulfate reductase domain-containing protein n=1 Tax=Rubrivivax gelatinosus TaxID=28068 RepID=UPI0002D742F2|nr:phosphoadenosine phosphosulfate reductase family protein [Rubrivivax gelatinosus]MBG6083052.1 3'-phosphoadenosine 5'-phosphosulfate sulfotransferase (PAPS reductase)/FAD synthetase [Rubrivivax gelatinosus]